MGRRAVNKLAYCSVIAFTIILFAVTAFGAIVQYISPAQSCVAPFIGLALSFLLIANVCMIIYWIIRWRVWFVVPIIAILINYQYIGRMFNVSTNKEDSNINCVKIATFNSDNFGSLWLPQTVKEVATYLQEQQIDVVCFQEFNKGNNNFPLDSICNVLKNWKYKSIPIAPDSLNRLQLAVFSRYPIKNEVLYTFKNTGNCAMSCDLNVCDKVIKIFNVHFQTTSASVHIKGFNNRNYSFFTSFLYNTMKLLSDMSDCFVMRTEQAQFVRKKINESPDPVIVCGDFNSLPSSYVYKTILGNDLKDGFCSSGHGYMYTFRYLKHLLRIDYILTSAKLKVVDYYSPHYDLHSDHYPVIMKMKIQ